MKSQVIKEAEHDAARRWLACLCETCRRMILSLPPEPNYGIPLAGEMTEPDLATGREKERA